MKISRINSNYYDYAIFEHYSNGFNFGDTLYMSGQYIYFDDSGYYDDNILNPYLNNKFIPEEIEVFKVTTS